MSLLQKQNIHRRTRRRCMNLLSTTTLRYRTRAVAYR
uniref:Uncharacterized protein n=1 Tax=Setaria italica TaxID=4555 RepID=K3YFK8_SETIT